MTIMRPILAAALLLVAEAAPAAELQLGPRAELRHPGAGHEVHMSGVALAAAPEGGALVAWAAQDGPVNHLWVARLGAGEAVPQRVNPGELTVEALHHPPRLAVTRTGEVYLSWSSDRPKPAGTLFASDLRLSRSLDGGRTFTGHLRVNEDRPISHSFDGLAVAGDGTVIVGWIDGREGRPDPATYVARVVEQGTRVAGVAKVGDNTCVCCRVDAATGPGDAVALLWRRVFPGDVRDMVLALSRDGGRSFGAPALVHADGWKIAGCPHRGGAVGLDAGGRAYATWYTEGAEGKPDLLFAVSTDGRRFGPPRRLHTAGASIPDHARMAVAPDGRAVIAWEDSTAVRRRILLRYTADAGRTLSPTQTLSKAIKAWEPDVVVGPDGQFLVAWQEEQFPSVKTVVQTIRVGAAR